MNILIDIKDLEKHKGLVPFKCIQCNKCFNKTKSETSRILKGTRKGLYCSRSCQYKHFKILRSPKQISYKCSLCEKDFTRAETYRRKNSLYKYCSKDCSIKALISNKANYKTKRSKLEKFIESKIKDEFSNLKLVLNDRVILGVELDFYFPELRFAIEFNGIVHYEPIYGNEKFERIQDKDKQKILQAEKLGIEICVIKDVQTKKERLEVWEKIKSILIEIVNRAK